MPIVNTWIADEDYIKYLEVRSSGKGAWTSWVHKRLNPEEVLADAQTEQPPAPFKREYDTGSSVPSKKSFTERVEVINEEYIKPAEKEAKKHSEEVEDRFGSYFKGAKKTMAKANEPVDVDGLDL